MTAESPPLPPAGWYNDPVESGKTRYWTGTSWGPQHVGSAAMGPRSLPVTTGSRNAAGIWAFVLGLAALVLFWVPVLYLLTSVAGGVVAISLGAKGRRLAAEGAASNRGIATAGLVLGIIGLTFASLNLIAGVIGGVLQATVG